MAAWRYEISLIVLKKYFARSLRSLVKYFATLEEKFLISARPCNILYLFQKHFLTLQGFLTDFIFLRVSVKLQLKNGMLMAWGKFLSLKLIQIWVCFSGQCYFYYARVYNSLKQGIFISSSYPIYSIKL